MLGRCERLDGITYLRIIASQGFAHAAAGDVHGVSRHHVSELRETFGSQFNAAVVVRDPLPRIRSQMALFEAYSEHPVWDIGYVDAVIERCGVTLPRLDYPHKFFVHAANMLNAILEERRVGKIYRSEDLTTRPEALGEFVEEITRRKVCPADQWLRDTVRLERVNAHSASAAEEALSDWQAEVIRKVVDPQSWELYRELGYSPPQFVGA